MIRTKSVFLALLAAIAVVCSTSAGAATDKTKKSKTPQRAHAVQSTKTTAAAKARKKPVTPVASKKARASATQSLRTRHSVVTAPIVIPVADARNVSHDAAGVAREFGRWLDNLEASNDVSGLAAAIVKDDQVLLERGIGYADYPTRERITGESVFRLASLSKAFATAMTGLLVEKGQLRWDTKVSGLLPTFTLNDATGSQRLTVRDILSHRVGLPHNTYDNLLEQNEPYELIVDQLKDVPLACPVGDCYGYQNIAFSLVGDVIFAATGDFYSHLVGKHIFHPLGMNTATYGRDALEASKSWARPHHRAGNGWVPFAPNENYYHVPPAAGVNASIRDMEQWLIAQMGGRPDVLSPALLAQLHKPLVETARELRASSWRRGRLNDAQYALGWRIYEYAGTTLVFHAGAVQGYRAMIAFLPKYRFGAVMLWNCESSTPSGLMPMLLDRYLGLPEVNWAGLDNDASPEVISGSE